MPAAKNLAVDLGTSGGDWLFRQEGLVLGPVPGAKLVEMLYAGQIDGNTEVAPMGSPSFRRLAEVDSFKVHHARSEAKRRVDAVAAADNAKRARARNLRLALIAFVAVGLAVGAAFVARYVAIHGTPFSELTFEDISVEAPTITVARAHVEDEELVDYPGGNRPARTGAPKSAADPGSVARAERSEKQRSIGSTTNRQKMSDPTADPDGMQTAQFDMASINAVVAQKQKSLFPCFVEEAKRTPGLAERIPLEFVIGNDGRVAKLWIDNPHFKTGPLYDCLLRELQKWPFKSYDGERATVNLSFNIGKKN